MERTEIELRLEIARVLETRSSALRAARVGLLSRGVELEEGRHLQLEVDPWSWEIRCATSNEDLLPELDVESLLPPGFAERCHEVGRELDELIADEIFTWLSRSWAALDGPMCFRPAFAFLHSYHSSQYDLEARIRVPLAVAVPER